MVRSEEIYGPPAAMLAGKAKRRTSTGSIFPSAIVPKSLNGIIDVGVTLYADLFFLEGMTLLLTVSKKNHLTLL